jgi:hypothetical protein
VKESGEEEEVEKDSVEKKEKIDKEGEKEDEKEGSSSTSDGASDGQHKRVLEGELVELDKGKELGGVSAGKSDEGFQGFSWSGEDWRRIIVGEFPEPLLKRIEVDQYPGAAVVQRNAFIPDNWPSFFDLLIRMMNQYCRVVYEPVTTEHPYIPGKEYIEDLGCGISLRSQSRFGDLDSGDKGAAALYPQVRQTLAAGGFALISSDQVPPGGGAPVPFATGWQSILETTRVVSRFATDTEAALAQLGTDLAMLNFINDVGVESLGGNNRRVVDGGIKDSDLFRVSASSSLVPFLMLYSPTVAKQIYDSITARFRSTETAYISSGWQSRLLAANTTGDKSGVKGDVLRIYSSGNGNTFLRQMFTAWSIGTRMWFNLDSAFPSKTPADSFSFMVALACLPPWVWNDELRTTKTGMNFDMHTVDGAGVRLAPLPYSGLVVRGAGARGLTEAVPNIRFSQNNGRAAAKPAALGGQNWNYHDMLRYIFSVLMDVRYSDYFRHPIPQPPIFTGERVDLNAVHGSDVTTWGGAIVAVGQCERTLFTHFRANGDLFAPLPSDPQDHYNNLGNVPAANLSTVPGRLAWLREVLTNRGFMDLVPKAMKMVWQSLIYVYSDLLAGFRTAVDLMSSTLAAISRTTSFVSHWNADGDGHLVRPRMWMADHEGNDVNENDADRRSLPLLETVSLHDVMNCMTFTASSEFVVPTVPFVEDWVKLGLFSEKVAAAHRFIIYSGGPLRPIAPMTRSARIRAVLEKSECRDTLLEVMDNQSGRPVFTLALPCDYALLQYWMFDFLAIDAVFAIQTTAVKGSLASGVTASQLCVAGAPPAAGNEVCDVATILRRGDGWVAGGADPVRLPFRVAGGGASFLRSMNLFQQRNVAAFNDYGPVDQLPMGILVNVRLKVISKVVTDSEVAKEVDKLSASELEFEFYKKLYSKVINGLFVGTGTFDYELPVGYNPQVGLITPLTFLTTAAPHRKYWMPENPFPALPGRENFKYLKHLRFRSVSEGYVLVNDPIVARHVFPFN